MTDNYLMPNLNDKGWDYIMKYLSNPDNHPNSERRSVKRSKRRSKNKKAK